jgi:hypothetical protein
MTVDQSEPEAQYCTLVRGDNLSKISKTVLRGPEQVREDLRGEQTDAEEPRPHLSGTDVAHTAALNR